PYGGRVVPGHIHELRRAGNKGSSEFLYCRDSTAHVERPLGGAQNCAAAKQFGRAAAPAWQGVEGTNEQVANTPRCTASKAAEIAMCLPRDRSLRPPTEPEGVLEDVTPRR